MTALIVVLVILFLLAWLPVGAELQYDGSVLVALRLGPVKIRILPSRPKKEKKPDKKKKKQKKKKKPDKKKKQEKQEAPKRSIGGTVEAALPLVRVAVDALQRFRHMLLFRDLTVHVTYGASDPASAAIGYGQAWAAIGIVTPLIDRVFRIRHRDYQAYLDYEQKDLKIFIHAHLTIFIWEIISFAVVYGVRALRAFLKFKKAGKPAEKERDGADS